jgi:hypothetical protein
LLDRVEDVVKHELTILPNELIVELRSLKKDPAWDKFSEAFCEVYRQCFGKVLTEGQKRQQMGHKIWVFRQGSFQIKRTPKCLVDLINEAQDADDYEAMNDFLRSFREKLLGLAVLTKVLSS